MQKAINVVALLSGLVSLVTLSTGIYVYKNQDVLVEDARKQITKEITKAVSELLPATPKLDSPVSLPVKPF
jgi:hypothetical protein